MPPPSSGGVHLVEILNLIGDTDLKAMGWHNPDALHLITEAMKIAYADRAEYLGDPAFVKVPVKALISPEYAQQRRQEIDRQNAHPSKQVRPGNPRLIEQLQGKLMPGYPTPLRSSARTNESVDTSHLSVVDGSGNAVTLTFTVNLRFGAGVVVPGTGIILNNEMDDFATAPGVPNAFGLVGRDANAVAPGKTPFQA